MSSPGVLFDLYGTLVLSRGADRAWRAWMTALREAVQRFAPDARILDDAGLRSSFWDQEVDETTGPDQTPFEARIAAFINHLGGVLPSGESRPLADRLCEVWQDELVLDPRAAPVLETLRARSPVGLVTNFDHPPHVRRVVRDTGLEELFGLVVVSGEEGVSKPDPAILTTAAQRLDLSPGRCAYVGDSMVDLDAAVAAGMRPVIVRRDGRRFVDTPTGEPSSHAEEEARLWQLRDRGQVGIVAGLDEVVREVKEIW